MVDEYAMFRHVVCEKMRCETPWPAAIMARVHAFIDAAVRTASHEFARLDVKKKVQPFVQQCDDSDRKAVAAQVELRDAQQQLDEAHDERDADRDDIASLLEETPVRERVVALLSHDLRSPLSSILINAQRMEKKSDDAAFANIVAQRIIRAANRIDHMIQDMLNASRLRAGRGMPLTLGACDMAHMAAEAYDDYAVAEGARINLRGPPQVRGTWDSGAVLRAIDNLVEMR